MNLTRIESRPRRAGSGHYLFFVDIEGARRLGPRGDALEAVGGPWRSCGYWGRTGGPLAKLSDRGSAGERVLHDRAG